MLYDVYLDDCGKEYHEAEEYYAQAADWAQLYCKSFKEHHVQDVSDFSMTNDIVAMYLFEESADVIMFQLKWK